MAESIRNSLVSPRADPVFVRALDEHIRDQVALLEAGEPLSPMLAHTVFGVIAWPLALGRPPGNLGDAFAVEVSYDVWMPYRPAGRETTWLREREPALVRTIEGRGMPGLHRAYFVASGVPDGGNPPSPDRPIHGHVALKVRNANRWDHGAVRRAVPARMSFRKKPGAMLLHFEVVGEEEP